MDRPEFIQATRIDESGEKEYVVNLMLLSSHTSGFDVERVQIQVHPISTSRYMGDRQFVTEYSHGRTHYSFNLELIKEDKFARFATQEDALLPDGLRSCGLGSYVLSKLIEWGVSRTPSYRVKRLKLSYVDAKQMKNGTEEITFIEIWASRFTLRMTHKSGMDTAMRSRYRSSGLATDQTRSL